MLATALARSQLEATVLLGSQDTSASLLRAIYRPSPRYQRRRTTTQHCFCWNRDMPHGYLNVVVFTVLCNPVLGVSSCPRPGPGPSPVQVSAAAQASPAPAPPQQRRRADSPCPRATAAAGHSAARRRGSPPRRSWPRPPPRLRPASAVDQQATAHAAAASEPGGPR